MGASEYMRRLGDKALKPNCDRVLSYCRPATNGQRDLAAPFYSAIRTALGKTEDISSNAGANILHVGLRYFPDWIILECPANRSIGFSVNSAIERLASSPARKVLVVNKYHGQAWSDARTDIGRLNLKRDDNGNRRIPSRHRLFRTHPHGPENIRAWAERHGWHVVMTDNRHMEEDLFKKLSDLKNESTLSPVSSPQ